MLNRTAVGSTRRPIGAGCTAMRLGCRVEPGNDEEERSGEDAGVRAGHVREAATGLATSPTGAVRAVAGKVTCVHLIVYGEKIY